MDRGREGEGGKEGEDGRKGENDLFHFYTLINMYYINVQAYTLYMYM